MKRKERLLLVEDIDTLRQVYATSIATAGFEVDAVRDLTSALARVDELTYDAVVLDVQLVEQDSQNVDGLAVMARVQELDEGTLTIILTSRKDPQFAADMLQFRGAFRFVSKAMLVEERSAGPLLEAVRAAVASRTIKRYGGCKNVLDLLAGSEVEEIWIDRCLRLLDPRGGYRSLGDFCEQLFSGLLPICPPRELRTPEWLMVVDQEACLQGLFWSKGQGIPVLVEVYSSARWQREMPDPWQRGEVLLEHEKAGMQGIVSAAERVPRGWFK